MATWNFDIVFVARDGTEMPVRGQFSGDQDGAETLLADLEACADRLGLTVNCGLVAKEASDGQASGS